MWCTHTCNLTVIKGVKSLKTNNLKNGTTHKTYYCTKCKKCFTLDENGKVVQTEYIDCIRCNEKGCAVRNGVYTRQGGKQMQQYMCKKCKKTFTQPINKNAEE